VDNPIKKDDLDLFRKAVGPVKPLAQNTVFPQGRRPRPSARQTRLDEQRVLREIMQGVIDIAELETGDELLFVRNGISPRLLKQLRRGYFPVEAEIDLHGLTVAEAKEVLADFLHGCRRRGRRCVRVIHGKGYGSFEKKPVLKNKTSLWLQHWDDVLAFCSARPVDGGTGAAYVLLKQGRQP
jgi:DNA-nicking Smr family endonuclease